VTRPEYDFQLPTAGDRPGRFSATVEVQPLPEVVDWTALEVPRIETEVPEDLIASELDALRGRSRSWYLSEIRAAQAGDAVVVDAGHPVRGSRSPTPVVELGAGRLVEEVETALVGTSIGRDEAGRV